MGVAPIARLVSIRVRDEQLVGREARDDLGPVGRDHDLLLDPRRRYAVLGRAVGLERDDHASLSSTGCSRELSRLMIGRSWRNRPTLWPNWRPNASISLSNPKSCARGQTEATWSVVTPGRM